LAGTVEATVATDFSGARNAAAAVVTAGVVLAGAVVLLLVVLAALPHPAIASAATGIARISFLRTGLSSR
jgi:hypothetical protein